MENTTLLGIDIGGTTLNIGRVENSIIVKEICKSVDKNISKEELLFSIFNSIDSVINSNVKAIGVGVPAVVDPLTGVVYDVQNIPSWKEIALKYLLEKRYNLSVYINNDANCFALGEKIFGKCKNYKNFIGLSIGTGIGMGVIINDRLYNGVFCGAGEVGMLPYKDSIIENYASSLFFSNTYKISAKELSNLAKNGNQDAINIFNEFGEHLGEAIKSILYMFAPESIILGGSISKSFPLFKKYLEASLKSFAYQKQIENLKIEVSTQPGLSILGATSLCLQHYKGTL